MSGAPESLVADVVVVGSGVAGCSAALALAKLGARVVVLTKDRLGESNTRWAQGGIAAVLPGTGDRAEDHLADTLAAGAGLCDPAATELLVREAAAVVGQLLADGAVLDRDAGGELARSREGGHRTARVVHAGGAATGQEVSRAQVQALAAAGVAWREQVRVTRLLVDGGRCRGLLARDGAGRALRAGAPAVLLATGGAGCLFALTTNPPGATGDGMALALAAGVPLADLELVQFHPTALAVEAAQRPLLSEALRGEGALLLDGDGQRFVDELAPRDVVSRAMAARMAAEGSDHLFLDARPVERFAGRFPALAAALAGAGLDPSRDLLPVAPAAHFFSGGVLTDLDGASALPGLWAVGEVACTGVHGANRLASNSLLEGLVFGTRAAAAIVRGKSAPEATGALGPFLDPGVASGAPGASLPVRTIRLPPLTTRRPAPPPGLAVSTAARAALARAASAGVGVVRDPGGLEAFARALRLAGAALPGPAGGEPPGWGGREVAEDAPARERAAFELAQLTALGEALLAAASARQESRGGHLRTDFPRTEEVFRLRLALIRERPPGSPGASRAGEDGG